MSKYDIFTTWRMLPNQALLITRPDKVADLGLGEVLLDKVKQLVFN